MSALLETPADMHRMAFHIRSSADTVRERARTLALAADATHWYSPAAAEFRSQVRDVARQMQHAADRLDAAAHTLDNHARRVHSLVSASLAAPAHAIHAAAHAVGF